MSNRPTTVERAFELARSGACRNLEEIISRLKAEGLDSVEGHVAGASIRSELRQVCHDHRRARKMTDPASSN